MTSCASLREQCSVSAAGQYVVQADDDGERPWQIVYDCMVTRRRATVVEITKNE